MKHLSKSDYLKFRIHPAYLWYQKNQPRKLPKPDANQEYVFEQGRQFEALAQKLFPAAVEVEGQPWEFEQLTTHTEQVIETADVMFQASFMTQDRLFCRSDIIERTDKGWILSEVKSSTSVKQSHIFDVAFQKLVMEQLGYSVVGCRVLHVNRYYRRKEEIKPESIVAIRDITEEVDTVSDQVAREVREAQEVMELAEVDDHPAFAGNLSDWLPIYEHLHPELSADSVLKLASIKPQLVREWYNQGVESVTELDEHGLNERQAWVVRTKKAGAPHVEPDKVRKFLDELRFPLYFLDYETSAHVIPLYPGVKPYQQVPFQYSLHVLRSPGAELEHYEYLHTDTDQPAATLSQHLLERIGEDGTVLAWFDKFEKYCNRTLAELAPEHGEGLLAINQRMKDLRIPFANNAYVEAGFMGSTSIKNVLPVLVPELSYKTLGIQEGGAAQREWQQVVFDGRDDAPAVYDNLREYCKLDTLAMVEIYKRLLSVAEYQPAPAQPTLF